MTNGTDIVSSSDNNHFNVRKDDDENIDTKSTSINAPVKTKRIKHVSYKV